jgi:hypothetical protein
VVQNDVDHSIVGADVATGEEAKTPAVSKTRERGRVDEVVVLFLRRQNCKSVIADLEMFGVVLRDANVRPMRATDAMVAASVPTTAYFPLIGQH